MASEVFSLITSLASIVVTYEYELLGSLRTELRSIKDEFEQMKDFLHGAQMFLQHQSKVRSWVEQVRDVAYDIEDALNEFVMGMGCSYHHPKGISESLKKITTKPVMAVYARHQLAEHIKELKTRITNISETHQRYVIDYKGSLDEQASSSRFSHVTNNMPYDKRRDALLLDGADLVGIEIPKKKLTDLLLNPDPQRNVISIAGMGGLGKTTLVKKVYDDVTTRGQFPCHVWITVRESFNLEDLFKNAIKKLRKDQMQQQVFQELNDMDIDGLKEVLKDFLQTKKYIVPQEVDDMDIDRLKESVKDFLQTKKYLVVFDDVWHTTHWEAIHLAFPRNQLGSRVVVTTRNINVCPSENKEGVCTFPFKPLAPPEAMQLFCKEAFGGSISCPEDLMSICTKILETCNGLPLAIAVIGSVLSSRRKTAEDWELFYKTLNMEMESSSSQLDEMSKLISLSYFDLPLYLNNCFLHLSIFPQGFQIGIDLLSSHWIAEGFVKTTYGMTLEEVAEGYVNELVARHLVEVVQTFTDGSIHSIRVHDIIRRIILVKAKEQHITTIFRAMSEESTFQGEVRRLALHGSIIDHSKQVQRHCKSIRSLYMFHDVGDAKSEPFLSDLLLNGRMLVKVLNLAYVKLESIPYKIFKLFHLKHLSLENTNVKSVSKSIGNLHSLQTLNLLETSVTELPAEIEMLQHLRHLLVGCSSKGVKVCCKIGNLKSLQQLYYIEASKVDNYKIVTEIGKLVELRVLRITELKKEDGKELSSSLGNLRKLRRLKVYSRQEDMINIELLESTDLPRLHSLSLYGRLEKNPDWISSLKGLTMISLEKSKLSNDPLACLCDLPNLISLYLTNAYQGESLCFKPGGFPKLKKLYLVFLSKLRCVTMDKNSLPSLQLLYFRYSQSMQELPTGFENLEHLQELVFSDMPDALVNNIENLDKQGSTYKRLLLIPIVKRLRTSSDGGLERLSFNKETGKFQKLTSG